MSNMFRDLVKATGNEFASVVEDGVVAGDITGYVDTGSYALNGLLSGSIFKGIPNNKQVAFAGEEATGKSFFCLAVVANFLAEGDNNFVVYFESESAQSKATMESRGIDTSRVAVVPVITVQQFRTEAMRVITAMMEVPEKKRPNLMFVLDSLGMLSTTKEMEDIEKGSEKKDMTRQQVIRAAFRALTLKLGAAQIPLIIANHTYEMVGSFIPQKEMSGGGGLKYAASAIIYLTKAKERADGGVVGNVITCTATKSRQTIENKKVKVFLSYKSGLDRYYGINDIAEKYKLISQVKVGKANGWKYGDVEMSESQIEKDPTAFYTKELLAKIDEAFGQEFSYGQYSASTESDDEVEE